MEYAEKLQMRDEIMISVRFLSRLWTMAVEACEGELRLRTRKRDRQNHGLGLENLQEAVEKTQGKVKKSAENGNFELDILVKAFGGVE